jgi:hypothetical protein
MPEVPESKKKEKEMRQTKKEMRQTTLEDWARRLGDKT